MQKEENMYRLIYNYFVQLKDNNNIIKYLLQPDSHDNNDLFDVTTRIELDIESILPILPSYLTLFVKI